MRNAAVMPDGARSSRLFGIAELYAEVVNTRATGAGMTA